MAAVPRSRRRHARRTAVLAAWLVVVVVSAGGCSSMLPVGRSPEPTPRVPTAGAPAVRLTPVPGLPGDPEAGRRAFLATGCGGCHTLTDAVYPDGGGGASGLAGPILSNVVLRPTLAGETIPMSPETLTRWLLEPAAVKPGTAMPSVGLDEQQARDLTAYLYSLPRTPP
jgi:cytochrome c